MLGIDVLGILAAFLLLQGSLTVDMTKTAQAPANAVVCHNYNNIGCK